MLFSILARNQTLQTMFDVQIGYCGYEVARCTPWVVEKEKPSHFHSSKSCSSVDFNLMNRFLELLRSFRFSVVLTPWLVALVVLRCVAVCVTVVG